MHESILGVLSSRLGVRRSSDGEVESEPLVAAGIGTERDDRMTVAGVRPRKRRTRRPCVEVDGRTAEPGSAARMRTPATETSAVKKRRERWEQIITILQQSRRMMMIIDIGFFEMCGTYGHRVSNVLIRRHVETHRLASFESSFRGRSCGEWIFFLLLSNVVVGVRQADERSR